MYGSGLCGSCAECRIVRTERSTFYLCERSRTDPRFRRYPATPVRECAGYVAAAGVASAATAADSVDRGAP